MHGKNTSICSDSSFVNVLFLIGHSFSVIKAITFIGVKMSSDDELPLFVGIGILIAVGYWLDQHPMIKAIVYFLADHFIAISIMILQEAYGSTSSMLRKKRQPG
jgi:hypothetical protein